MVSDRRLVGNEKMKKTDGDSFLREFRSAVAQRADGAETNQTPLSNGNYF